MYNCRKVNVPNPHWLLHLKYLKIKHCDFVCKNYHALEVSAHEALCFYVTLRLCVRFLGHKTDEQVHLQLVRRKLGAQVHPEIPRNT